MQTSLENLALILAEKQAEVESYKIRLGSKFTESSRYEQKILILKESLATLEEMFAAVAPYQGEFEMGDTVNGEYIECNAYIFPKLTIIFPQTNIEQIPVRIVHLDKQGLSTDELKKLLVDQYGGDVKDLMNPRYFFGSGLHTPLETYHITVEDEDEVETDLLNSTTMALKFRYTHGDFKGKKLAVVKEFRDTMNWGLKDSKDYCDTHIF